VLQALLAELELARAAQPLDENYLLALLRPDLGRHSGERAGDQQNPRPHQGRTLIMGAGIGEPPAPNP